jgi:murein DD-endopeptidase MepM/ murein hydrolase activator NlpD
VAPLGKLPALPTLVGAAALLTAAGGALGMSQALPQDGNISLSAGAAALNGTDVNIDLSARDQAISRDSERQAVQHAAEAHLKAAAEAQSQQRSAALASLAKDAQQRADEIAANLWALPTVGYHLTARFGESSGLWAHTHTGLDFAGPVGAPILAVASGTITQAGYDGAYGYKTVETLDDGTEIWYCHQSSIDVSVGERISEGEHIGELGNTGNTPGPHLHLEVRPGGGDPVDPYTMLVEHGATP